MGRPDEDPDERTPLANKIVKKPSRRRSCLRKFLFIALVFAVVVASMSALVKLRNNPKDANLPGGKLPDNIKKPDVGLPDGSSGSYCSAATIKSGSILYDFSLSNKFSVLQDTYDGDSGYDLSNVKTVGEIRLRRLPKDSKYRTRGVLAIETYISDERLQVKKQWDENAHLMKVSVPKYSTAEAKDLCISLEITIWLPQDATLPELSVVGTVLTIRVFDDIKVDVTGEASFVSVTGDIFFLGLEDSIKQHPKTEPSSFPLDSRHITVETVTGNIKGVFPLYDHLTLVSVSGEIQAAVFPQPVLRSEPAPADLEISTTSGNIIVHLPIKVPTYTPPARDYVTRVTSQTGDIKGSYFLGSVGIFSTTTGDITASVLPVVQYSPSTDPDDAPNSQFETRTSSGDQKLHLLKPIFISLLPSNSPDQHNQPNDPQTPNSPGQHHSPQPFIPIGDNDPYQDLLPPELNNDVGLGYLNPSKMIKRKREVVRMWRTLKALHTSKAADIELYYPIAWEGTVTETTIRGSTSAVGKDVKLIESGGSWPRKKYVAGKGVSRVGEGSSVMMDALSGDLKFVVEEGD